MFLSIFSNCKITNIFPHKKHPLTFKIKKKVKNLTKPYISDIYNIQSREEFDYYSAYFPTVFNRFFLQKYSFSYQIL